MGALRSTFSQRWREAEWVELLEAQGLSFFVFSFLFFCFLFFVFFKSAAQSQVRQGGEDVWLGSNNL